MTARPRREDGFTLVELLLVSAIVAVVIPTVAAVMMIYFRTAFTASVRVDRAHDSNLLASYLLPDVASATATDVSGCASSITFRWSQSNPTLGGGAGTDDTYGATYGLVSAGGADGPFVLKRSYVVNGAAAGSQVVAHSLAGASAVSLCNSSGAFTAAVSESDSSGNAEPYVIRVSGKIGGRS